MADLAEMVEVKSFREPGYKPLIFSDGWQVAILNSLPLLSPEHHPWMIERHCKTDEVFLLSRGRAWLLLAPKGDRVADVEIVEMEKDVVYNVLAGVWHSLVASEDASWLIVENKDTHLTDVQYNEIPEKWREEIRRRWTR